MSGSSRVFSIPPGAPFLPTLAEALLAGRLVPGFRFDGKPLALADVTIYVPTRRAARALRGVFVDSLKARGGGGSAILPVIRPLGEFDEDEAAFDAEPSAAIDLAPPIAATERLLLLTPLVRAWKRRLPEHVSKLFAEEIVIPASTADAIWLARDLAGLMDEIETEGTDWAKLAGLVTGNLAGWWQVTLEFLGIVTEAWGPLGRGDAIGDPVIGEIAQAHGRTPAQVIIRWHLQLGTIAIPKSATPERVTANFDVFGFELTDDDLERIAGLERGARKGPHPDAP